MLQGEVTTAQDTAKEDHTQGENAGVVFLIQLTFPWISEPLTTPCLFPAIKTLAWKEKQDGLLGYEPPFLR